MTAPSWHELVQPGPKADPAKKAKRLAAERHGVWLVQHTTTPRVQRRAAHGRGWNPGRLVNHPGRMRPVSGHSVPFHLALTGAERKRLKAGRLDLSVKP